MRRKNFIPTEVIDLELDIEEDRLSALKIDENKKKHNLDAMRAHTIEVEKQNKHTPCK